MSSSELLSSERLALARRYVAAGLSVIPVKTDGSKGPALSAWKEYQNRLATDAELVRWFGGGPKGVAIIAGTVSGGLEVLDLETPGVVSEFFALVDSQAPGLLDRLPRVQTPGDGAHFYYRCAEIAGSTKLARGLNDDGKEQLLIETKGEGGYVLAPGCPKACHPSQRPYVEAGGKPIVRVPLIEDHERALLWAVCRSLNDHDPHEPVRSGQFGDQPACPGNRPGDDFNRDKSWEEVLEPHGWALVRRHGDTCYWRRPGKDGKGTSATTGKCASENRGDLLYVFSSNAAPLECDRSYSKFEAYTFLNHGGDFRKAAAALNEGVRVNPTKKAEQVKDSPSQPDPLAFMMDRPHLHRWTHLDLMKANLPPLKWLVEGLVPDESLTMLGGKKKIGKSWLLLQIAQAVVLGAETLGKRTEKGSVVYICLEDGERRLRSRLNKQQAAMDLPITYYTSFPKLDGEGMAELVGIIQQDKPRLLIIDTLAAAKTGKTDENAAGDMGDLANTLRQVAQHFKIANMITHHHGKMVGGDPGDDLRGSSALAAAADVNLGIYKLDGSYSIKGEGRDIEPFGLPIAFDAYGSWKWHLSVNQNDQRRDDADEDILRALAVLGEADAGQVAEKTGRSRQAASEKLSHLANASRVICREDANKPGKPRKLYRLPAKAKVYDEDEDELA